MRLVGDRRVFSVEDVSRRLAGMFEGLASFWVEAEIQDLRPAGRQVRFTLRGEHAMDASMNGIVFDRLPHRPQAGAMVQAYGRMEFWRQRGQLSMRVERLELAGEGLLRARVQELRLRLEAEGLLDDGRKRRPPLLPRRVGVVTSAEGAARGDVLTSMWTRFPRADVVLVGVAVQGDNAPIEVARAVAHLDRLPEVDVIIVARGGGSLEDLMAFNSEVVCRAVAGSHTPVISAVGHERDVTLCDLVADVRASTPTAAAMEAVPSADALNARLADAALAIGRGLERAGAAAGRSADRRAQALTRALRTRGALVSDRVERLAPRLESALVRVAAAAPAGLEARAERLGSVASTRIEDAAGRVERAAALLALLSPERTVARGYAIVRDAADGGVIASAEGVEPGRDLILAMRDGRLAVRTGEALG